MEINNLFDLPPTITEREQQAHRLWSERVHAEWEQWQDEYERLTGVCLPEIEEAKREQPLRG